MADQTDTLGSAPSYLIAPIESGLHRKRRLIIHINFLAYETIQKSHQSIQNPSVSPLPAEDLHQANPIYI